MSWRDALRPLQERPFRILFTGRLADNLAHAVAPIALAFAVLDLGGTPGQLGIVLACRGIPLVLLVLFGGVIADRLPRHQVLVVANLVAAAAQTTVAVLLLSGNADIWMLGGLEVVNGAASAFLFPAASGLTPQTVPATMLQPANALLRLGHNAAFISGAAGAGVLVALVGAGWAFALDAGLYLLGAVLLSRIVLPARDPADDRARPAETEPRNVLHELREGWVEFAGRSWLWVTVAVFSFFNGALTVAVATLGPVVADETIGRAAWGLVLAAQAAGMFAGGLVAMRLVWQRPLAAGFGCALVVPGMVLVLGLNPSTWPLVVTAFLAGVSIEVFVVNWDVTMQSHVPQEKLSRVYAYDWFGSLAVVPLAQILAGPISAAGGIRETIVGCAVVMLATGVLALSVPSIRQLRRTDEAREPVSV